MARVEEEQGDQSGTVPRQDNCPGDRDQRAAISANKCAVKYCTETENLEVHHVRKLIRSVDKNGKIVVQLFLLGN